MSTKIVAIGGGTGLPNILRAFSLIGRTGDISAVVNVVDDGGSSGRLRECYKVPPPGDARNCINATANNKELSKLFNFRFDGSCELTGHNLGNLIITALTKEYGDLCTALNKASNLLDSMIEVLPATNEAITLTGYTESGKKIDGQINIANNQGIDKVVLTPKDPVAFHKAVAKIEQAKIIILGPGSLYSSILPALLVPEIRKSLTGTANHRIIYFCNTVSYRKESIGYSVQDHLNGLRRNIPELKIDYVVVQDPTLIKNSFAKDIDKKEFNLVKVDLKKNEAAKLIEADLADDNNPRQHSPEKLSKWLTKNVDLFA